MHKTERILRTDLLEHPAVRFWEKISPVRADPDQLEVIKRKKEGSVYRLTGIGLGRSAVIAKRLRQDKAAIERIVYEKVLPNLPITSLHYYGVVEEQNGLFSWLFLEDIGNQRYSPQDKDQRRLAARWLAIMHTAAQELDVQAYLPDRGPDHYQIYLRSIRETIPQIQPISLFCPEGCALLKSIVSMCNILETRWDQVEMFCSRIPRTLVHGDCLAKNIHVRKSKVGPTVVPFDWGGAGWGLPATDLGQSGLPYHSVPQTYPDLATYFSFTKDRGSHLDLGTIQQLANLGKMFWCLKVISRGVLQFDQKWATFEDLLNDFSIYAAVLAETIRSANWDRRFMGPSR